MYAAITCDTILFLKLGFLTLAFVFNILLMVSVLQIKYLEVNLGTQADSWKWTRLDGIPAASKTKYPFHAFANSKAR